MWAYLAVAITLAFIVGILWVMQPYFTWRKSQTQKNGEEGKIIVIDTSGKTLGLQDHLTSKNKQ